MVIRQQLASSQVLFADLPSTPSAGRGGPTGPTARSSGWPRRPLTVPRTRRGRRAVERQPWLRDFQVPKRWHETMRSPAIGDFRVMDGDLDQILLLVVGFFVSLGVLLFLLAWLEPNTEHHGSGRSVALLTC
jgi:hypothetical protein